MRSLKKPRMSLNIFESKSCLRSRSCLKEVHSFSFLLADMHTHYGGQWTLILPVVTRWTVYAATTARLLKVNKSLEMTAVEHYDEIWEGIDVSKLSKKNRVTRVLKNARDREWWRRFAE
jgi:hypothetical protein